MELQSVKECVSVSAHTSTGIDAAVTVFTHSGKGCIIFVNFQLQPNLNAENHHTIKIFQV